MVYMTSTKTMERMDESKAPEPVITNTDDGMVRVAVGNEFGWVSSHHLVPPKVNQLTQTWEMKHNKS